MHGHCNSYYGEQFTTMKADPVPLCQGLHYKSRESSLPMKENHYCPHTQKNAELQKQNAMAMSLLFPRFVQGSRLCCPIDLTD